MVKKGKKWIAAVMAALFVLSVGYFALLAPTTAWFYQEYDSDYAFKFGDFHVDYVDPTEDDPAEYFSETLDVQLRDATRFADAGEILFDEVAHVIKVEAENDGNVPAQVYVSVKKVVGQTETELPNWLKYFVFEAPSGTSISKPNVANNTKGSFKQAIDTMLAAGLGEGQYTTDYADLSVESGSRDNAEVRYETGGTSYNKSALAVLNRHNASPISFIPKNPNDATDTSNKKDIYIVFWAEYGLLSDGFRGMNSVVSMENTSVKVTMKAEPDLVAEQTLEITNSGSTSASVSVLVDLADANNPGFNPYSGAYVVYNPSSGGSDSSISQGALTIAAGNSARISLRVGTPFKVQLTGTSAQTMEFDAAHSDGTVSGTEITGTTYTDGNTVVIQTVQAQTP